MNRLFIIFISLVVSSQLLAQQIDRKNLVQRHAIVNSTADSLSSLSVGNGMFAFTVDVTGLQSFPDFYAKGVPLGTESEWGWHSFHNLHEYKFEETLKDYNLNGKRVSYSVQLKSPERSKEAVEYFRQNPHRLQLGNIGFEITKKDGSLATINDIQNIHQSLDMWSGEIHSQFTIENIPVEVYTNCHQQKDVIGVKVNSLLIKEERLKIRIRLPYPTGNWGDIGNNWNADLKHQTNSNLLSNHNALITHRIDTTGYTIGVHWKGYAHFLEKQKHYYTLTPSDDTTFGVSFRFFSTTYNNNVNELSFEDIQMNSGDGWHTFWKSGGAIDFKGSKDPRAFELERRIILSQYLTKIQCAGNYPPQETGLTYNSWYGKPHLEMHWWHALHFALWGRKELLEKSMKWYETVADKAFAIARRQGYDGLRWQKMTDREGEESPSSVGAFLIWQQPHFISFAELCYNESKDDKILQRYKGLVFATADFMASYARYDSSLHRYVLGKGVIPAQERFKAEETFNPTYELVYWYWSLQIAQEWRVRLNLPKNKKWDDVLKNLSPLPTHDGKYLFTESGTDSYTNKEYRTDHPSVLGSLGMLPKTGMVDEATIKKTFDWIWTNWNWKATWGWDFPMTAMTATRLGLPAKAIDVLLMPVQTNTYLSNGHNYQDQRLTIYLPGNGGLLTAIAMMCAGWKGNKIENPGIPKDGNWTVKWEGLKKMF